MSNAERIAQLDKLARERGAVLVPGQQYVNNKTKMHFTCAKHGAEYEQSPQNLAVGKAGCPQCAREGRRAGVQKAQHIDPTHRLEELRALARKQGGDIARGQTYTNAHAKITLTCNQHGTTFTQTPDRLTRGHWGCPVCSRNPAEYLARAAEDAKQHGGELLSGQEWRGNKTKLRFRCVQHGLTFEQEPRNVRSHWGCPQCKAKWIPRPR